MAYDTPKITSSGQGMWGNSSPADHTAGSSQNALTTVGKTGSTPAPFTNNPSGPGAGERGGSPDPNLLSTGTDGSKGPGAGSGPSPDQSLLSTRGKSAGVTVRKPSFGGMEKGVQIP